MSASRRIALLALGLSLLLCDLKASFSQGSRQISEYDSIEEKDRDNPAARDAWFMRGRTPPPGQSAATLRYKAYQQKLQMRRWISASEGATPTTTGGTPWTPLGPAPMVSAAYPGSPQDYNLVSGRATAVAIDPADSSGNTVYIGGAHGGIWKSRNAATPTVSAVTWTPVADFAGTLSVGSIAIQPGNADPSKSVILIGTGEPNNSADSYYGLGILRSADAGSTWTLIASDQSGHSFAGLGFSKIAFSTDNRLLAVAAAATAYTGAQEGLANQNNRGIYVSTNGGQTWNFASILDVNTPIGAASVTSVIYHPAVHKFFAAIRFHGIYSSPDGANWTRLPDANQPGSNLSSTLCPPSGSASCLFYRAELTVPVVASGSQPRNELYTWVVDYDTNSGLMTDGGIWINASGGTTPWKPIVDSGITNCGDADGCGINQGTYNLEIQAMANGAGTDLYAGTINLYKCTISNPSAPSPSCSFLNLTHVYGCSSIAKVHPDQHHLAGVLPATNAELMYFANDGGIYRALDGYTGLRYGACGSGTNAFDSLNGTLGSMTQFVSISIHPTDSTVTLGGTQDNGSPMTHSGLPGLQWQNVHAGDGGYNAINPATPTDWYTSYPDTGLQTLHIDYCAQGITCDANSFDPVVLSGKLGGDDGAFYFPYTLDPQATNELIVGTCRIWRVNNASAPTGFSVLSQDFEPGGITPCTGSEVNTVRAIAAGGPRDSNGFSKVIYAGTDGYGPIIGGSPLGGRIFVTTDAGVPTPVFTEITNGINPSAYPVSDIVIDSSDASGQTAYAAIMGFHVGHVFKTTNAGESWTDFTDSLPDAPVNSLILDWQAAVIYAGTDVGVFSSPTAMANWNEVGPVASSTNTGFLPNVPVTAMRLFNANGQKILRASTYGRGVWQYVVATVPDYSIAVSNSPMTLFGSQTSTFNGTLNSYLAYSSAVTLTCTGQLTNPPSTCTPPSPITPTAGGAPFSVTIAGEIGDYAFNIHGVGADSLQITHDAAVTLHVVDFALGAPSSGSVSAAQGNTSNAVSLIVSASGSFNGTVNLACSGLPAGAACNFLPSANVAPTSGAPVTVTLTISVPQTTPAPSTSNLTISAATAGAPAAKTQSLGLTVTPFSFTIANTTGTQTVKAGQSATYTLALTPLAGFPFPTAIQPACVSSDLPADAACAFNPVQVSAGATGIQSVTLTISTVGPNALAQLRSFAQDQRKTPLFLSVFIVGLWFTRLSHTPPRGRRALVTWAILLTAAFPLILTSCGGSPGGSSGGGSAVAISLSPTSASLYPTQTQQFTATVIGSANTAVTWSAAGGGTISPSGLYTAPASVTSSAQATVTAAAQADTTKSQTAPVALNAQTPSGSYTIHVNAVSGSVTQTTTATLIVQ